MGNDVGGPVGNPQAPSVNWGGSPRLAHTGAKPASASTDGNDTTPAVTETYLCEVNVAEASRVTGFANFNGSAVAGNVTAILYDSAGRVLAKSASTAQAGTDAFQRIPFAGGPFNLRPGTYIVGMQFNNTGARFNTHAFGNFGASKKTGEVYGTATAVTPPTTFTANQGPMGNLY